MPTSSTTTDDDGTNRTSSPLPEMPLLPITSQQTVEACRTLQVTDHDVFICSFPKSGTTWTQAIVCRLLAESLDGISLDDENHTWHLSHSAPFYEVDQYWETTSTSTPPTSSPNDGTTTIVRRKPAQFPLTSKDGKISYRVFNTHLRPHQLPSKDAKFIYVMRDPMDILASFYFHLANMAEDDGGYTGSPEKFCQDFVNGQVLYGRWQDHIEAWLSSNVEIPSENLLLLHYQDMKEDLNGEVTRLANFLGLVGDESSSSNGGSNNGNETKAIVETVVNKCTFESMKRERTTYTPKSVNWKIDPSTGEPYKNFIREGRVGDGRDFAAAHFSSKLEEKWNNDIAVAKKRWRQAGIDGTIIERYLGA